MSSFSPFEVDCFEKNRQYVSRVTHGMRGPFQLATLIDPVEHFCVHSWGSRLKLVAPYEMHLQPPLSIIKQLEAWIIEHYPEWMKYMTTLPF